MISQIVDQAKKIAKKVIFLQETQHMRFLGLNSTPQTSRHTPLTTTPQSHL